MPQLPAGPATTGSMYIDFRFDYDAVDTAWEPLAGAANEDPCKTKAGRTCGGIRSDGPCGCDTRPGGSRISSYVWQDRYGKLAAAGHDQNGRTKTNRSLFRRANAGYSLYCTPYEYAQFIVEIIKTDRSAEHSLSGQSIDAMLTRTTQAVGRTPITRSGKTVSDTVHWGLGWAINKTAGGDRIYHSGSNGTGFRCYCEFDRVRGTGIVIMTNAVGGRQLWERVIAHVAPP